MQSKISNSLLPKLKVEIKPYEVHDTVLKGFLLRVQPTGTIAFYCSYRGVDRKRNRFSLGRYPAVTPMQARDQARQVLAGIVQGHNPAGKRRTARTETLEAYLDVEYGPWVVAHRRDGEATLARLRACFISFQGSKLPEITASAVDKWRTHRKTAGTADATINRDVATLRSALSKAVEWGMVAQHPLEKVRPLKLDSNKVVRYLSAIEEARLRAVLDERQDGIRQQRASANAWRVQRQLKQLTDLKEATFPDHLKPMVLLSINTGMRQGELFHLKWSDVDLERANLTLAGESAKSGKTRHVPLNTEALASLKAWHKQTGARTLIFPSRANRPFDNVKRAWAGVLKNARIEKFRWHDLRHHFASRLVMAGVDLNTVRELLGHSDIKMTLRYAHLAPEHKAAAVEKLLGTTTS